jgi:hypothetical protein
MSTISCSSASKSRFWVSMLGKSMGTGEAVMEQASESSSSRESNLVSIVRGVRMLAGITFFFECVLVLWKRWPDVQPINGRFVFSSYLSLQVGFRIRASLSSSRFSGELTFVTILSEIQIYMIYIYVEYHKNCIH